MTTFNCFFFPAAKPGQVCRLIDPDLLKVKRENHLKTVILWTDCSDYWRQEMKWYLSNSVMCCLQNLVYLFGWYCASDFWASFIAKGVWPKSAWPPQSLLAAIFIITTRVKLCYLWFWCQKSREKFLYLINKTHALAFSIPITFWRWFQHSYHL